VKNKERKKERMKENGKTGCQSIFSNDEIIPTPLPRYWILNAVQH
jgi:hypothetical protein